MSADVVIALVPTTLATLWILRKILGTGQNLRGTRAETIERGEFISKKVALRLFSKKLGDEDFNY